MAIRGEPKTITLLNKHNPQLHCKYLSLYTQVSEVLIPHQEKLLFARDGDHYRKTTTGQDAENK